MRVRALDANGDFTFGKGEANYLSGRAAISQSIVTRVKSFLGDCYFDLEAGIDWFNFLGGKNQLGLDFNIRSVILNTVGVTGLTVQSATLIRATRLFIPSYLVTVVVPGAPIDTGSLFTNHLLTELGDILTTEDGIPLGI